jgi:hypothetical protein
VTRRQYRLVIAALGLALAAVVAIVVAVQPSGEPERLPAPLEDVFPEPGDAVVRQTVIEFELPVGYSFELVVDGTPIPAFEIGYTDATGRAVWQPGPGGVLTEWAPGDHTVVIRWEGLDDGLPDRGSYEWSFRVQ